MIHFYVVENTEVLTVLSQNYVIQCILETGRPEDKASVIAELRGRLPFMARHKLASNVCEKALAHADPEARHALIEEIMGPPSKPDATLIAVMIWVLFGSSFFSANP